MKKFEPGVLYGDTLLNFFAYAKEKEFALPAVNVTGTNTINAVLETAREVKSAVMIQLSNSGAAFYAGKGMSNEGQQASIAGGISGALHVHEMAKHYGVPVILHTDHAAKKLLPWIDGLLDAGEKRTTSNTAILCSARTCWTCRKSTWKKIWKPVSVTLSASANWIWHWKLNWV